MTNLVLLLCAVMSSAAVADDLAVTATVAEPANVKRVSGPASGGIPFKPRQVKDVQELALFDKDGKTVPAQFSRLASYDDGSVQWALLDVLIDLPAGARAEFVVRKGKAALPASPLEIGESDGKVTVNTGPAEFTVNTETFDLLESVKLNGRQVAGPGAVEVATVEGKVLKPGKVTRVKWEYRGPVRATLRIDGVWNEGDSEFLRFTTRLTFFAGLSSVRIDHSLRNSRVNDGVDAMMKWARVALDFAGRETAGDERQSLVMAGSGASLVMTQRHTGGAFPGGGEKSPGRYKTSVENDAATAWCVPEGSGGKGLYGYGDGFFALADLAHKDTEVWLDFSTGAPDPALSNARISKLLVLADPVWVSETAAMGYGKFGTLDDEIASYKKWGWKGWDDPKKLAATRRPHDPDAYVGCRWNVHFDTEADCAELGLLMYLRTGARGWFDQGEAWARYYKSHAVYRTDDFTYDGFRHYRDAIANKSRRSATSLRFSWYGPKKYGWGGSRFCFCHIFASGLFDYYCLTGDVDALEAGLDQAEISAVAYSDAKSAPGAEVVMKRSLGRNFKPVIRAYQVTRDEKWKKVMAFYMQMHLQAPNRGEWGLFASTAKAAGAFAKIEADMPPRLLQYCKENGITWKTSDDVVTVSKDGESWPITKGYQSFQYAACAEAVARCAEVTGDPGMKKLAIDMGRGGLEKYWSRTVNGLARTDVLMGFPRKGESYDPHEWQEEPGATGYHTRFFADIAARAYSFSGDKSFLEGAKRIWSRGAQFSKKQQIMLPTDQLYNFACTTAPKGDQVDIRNSMRLFYEAARAD